MKIARVDFEGSVEYAIVIGGRVFPRSLLEKALGLRLPEMLAEFAEYIMNPEWRSRIEKSIANLEGVRLNEVKLHAPVDDRPKIICVGLNYRDHAEEQGVKIPEEPVIFMKPYTAITGPEHPIVYPEITSQLDYEAELAVVMGRKCKKVRKEEALEYVLGYTCFNDVSARDIQFKDKQWVRGKSFDTFAPIGPWIVTGDEIGDPHSLRITAKVNGETRQDSNTGKLIFGVDYLISFISQVMTLEPCDIIATGTPAGVGIFHKPHPKLLKPGDTVEVEIEKIGKLTNRVIKC